MKRLIAELVLGLAFVLAIINPYAVTPFVFGKFPIYLACISAGLFLSIWIDEAEL